MTKRIIIHAGPPKTGTSALQKWLSDNTKYLESMGILYPAHNADSNGISSGNRSAIYSSNTTSDNDYLDNKKISKLLKEFEISNHNTLLLSSEYFFNRIEDIAKAIPQSHFLCYIRDPMSKRESLYNQGVKRHYFTHEYKSKINSKIGDLTIIQSFIDNFDHHNISIRFYGNEFFHNGNLVSDLLNFLDIELETTLPNVNISYQLEALEFKRWINQYNLKELNGDIDRALQRYSAGTSDYSFMKLANYREQREQDIALLKRFFKDKNIEKSDLFITSLRGKRNRKYKQQKLSLSDLSKIARYLHTELGQKAPLLAKVLRDTQSSDRDPFKRRILKIFTADSKPSFSQKVKNILGLKAENLSGKKIIGMRSFRKKLCIPKKTTDVDIYLELSRVARANGQIEFSDRLKAEANEKKILLNSDNN